MTPEERALVVIPELKNIITDPAPSREKKQQKWVYDTDIKAVDASKRQIRAVLVALKVDRDQEVLLPMGAEYDWFLAAGGPGAYNHQTYGPNLPVCNWLEFDRRVEKLSIGQFKILLLLLFRFYLLHTKMSSQESHFPGDITTLHPQGRSSCDMPTGQIPPPGHTNPSRDKNRSPGGG